jgi:hypothetical protein
MEHIYNIASIVFSVFGPVIGLFLLCFCLTSLFAWWDKLKYGDYKTSYQSKDRHKLTESHGSIKVRR